MLRNTPLALPAVTVCLAGVAEAKAKERQFVNQSYGGDEQAAGGFPAETYVSGKDRAILSLQLRDAAPNATCFAHASSFSDGSFTTDSKGRGYAALASAGDHFGSVVRVHRSLGEAPSPDHAPVANP